MGSHLSKPSNKSMVDRLVEHNPYIHSPTVESVFRAVDRAMYFDLEEGEMIDPYENDPWRRGNLHLSAPSIYAKVVEALELKSGLSFLNLGSGTGYLNTIIGLLVGPNGINHGIELHADVVEYAYKRLQQFKEKSYAMDKFDFSEPIFIKGNCLNLNPNSKYDRIYLGAACLPDLENFMKKLIKPNGGILVMPYENHLMRYIRVSETEWRSEKLMDVNFTLMIRPGDNESMMIDMPLAQAKSLKELCRIIIRQQLRDKTNLKNPSLLYSDNIGYRRLRKARAEQESFARQKLRSKTEPVTEWIGRRSKGSRQIQMVRKRSLGSSKEERCCCWQYAGDNLEASSGSPRTQSKSTHSQPSTSNETRVITRSASRKIVESRKKTITQNLQSSSRGTSLNEYHAETSSASGNGDDEDDDHVGMSEDEDSDDGDTAAINTSTYQGQTQEDYEHSSARTRPYVSNTPANRTMGNNNIRRRQPSCVFRPQLTARSGPSAPERFINGGPPALLPFPRQFARVTYSPSSPSSEDVSESDLPSVEEYDYVGRQVILSWPGFLGLHRVINPNELNLNGLDSSLSSESSGSETPGLDLEEGVSSDETSSWGESIYGERFSDEDSFRGSLAGSSIFGSDDDDDDDSNNDNDYDRPPETIKQKKLRNFRNLIQSRCQMYTDVLTPRAGTSRNHEMNLDGVSPRRERGADDDKRDEEALPASSEQAPVASRLRSKLPVTSPANIRERRQRDHPSLSPSLSSTARRSKTLHCPIHGPYSNAVPTDPLTSPPRHETTSSNRRPSRSNPPSSSASTLHVSCSNNGAGSSSSHRNSATITNATTVQRPERGVDDTSSPSSGERRVLVSSLVNPIIWRRVAPADWHFDLDEGGDSGSRLSTCQSARSTSGQSARDKATPSAAGSHRSKRKRLSSPSESSEPDEVEVSSRASLSSRHHGRRRQRRLAAPASCDCAAPRSAPAQMPTGANCSTLVPSNSAYDRRLSPCRYDHRPSLGASWARCESNYVCDDYCSNTSQSSSSMAHINSSNNGVAQGRVARSGQKNPGQASESAFHQTQTTNGGESFCLSPTPSGRPIGRRSRRTKECHHHHRNKQSHNHRRPSNTHHHHRLHAPSHTASSQGATAASSLDATSGRVRQPQPCMVFGSNEVASLRQRSQLREKRKRKRRESECERYHNHISDYIRQLPLPRVLHTYLNYDRASNAPVMRAETPTLSQ